MSVFAEEYLAETLAVVQKLDCASIENLISGLAALKKRSGRLFILGVGGSAGHASHAVNDFRKICRIEAYAPSDNVCELTARINDDGWDSSYASWLAGSHLLDKDGLLILSVGGGDQARNVSMNLVKAIEYGQGIGAAIFGVVGRDGGYARQRADACVVIPPLYADRITPHTEGLCSVVLHLIASHPLLKDEKTKWESVLTTTAPSP